MQKTYYSIIPAEVKYDADLSANAKLLFGEIASLCNERGYCWASNKYFADLYSLTIRTISSLIGELIKKGYLEVDGDDKGARKILLGGLLKSSRGVEKNFLGKAQKHRDLMAQPQRETVIENAPNSKVNSKEEKENAKVVFTSEEDVVFSPTDGDGEELPARPPKKPKGERKNEIALRIQKKFADMCEKHVGVRPIIDVKGYVAALYAINTGGLTEKQIYDLFDDWFGSDKADDLRMSINAALSARSINAFKLTI